jgi:hypothetical protein
MNSRDIVCVVDRHYMGRTGSHLNQTDRSVYVKDDNDIEQ